MSELGAAWALLSTGQTWPQITEQQGQRQRPRTDAARLCDLHRLAGGEAWLSLGRGENGGGIVERR